MSATGENGGKEMTDARIRLLCVDDHPLLREGLGAIINSQSDMSLVATASSGREAVAAFRACRPDVTLMDLKLLDVGGIDVMISILTEFRDARIIVLTTFRRDMEIQRALKAGAYGYLLKNMPTEQMLDTIRQVHAGKKCIPSEIAAGLAEHFGDEPLSDREVEVLRHVAAGTRNRDIGQRMFIAEDTVKVHLKHIMSKLRARDRTQSVAIAARRGIIHL